MDTKEKPGGILGEPEDEQQPIAKLLFYERSDLQFAIHGIDYWLCLWQLDQRLRSAEKYEDKEVVKVEEVREWIREELDQCGLTLDAW